MLTSRINKAPVHIDNTHKHTKSYTIPMDRDQVLSLLSKILIRFHKNNIAYIPNMTHWLNSNNFGSYQHNMWVRAIIDNVFKNTNGSWFPINQNLSKDQLADNIMVHWKNKLKHS